MKRTSAGFTIVELMIAMVIFMIICAIAIPNYMSATQRAHEAVAVSFLRQVETGEESYRLNNQQYADTFAKLQPYISADLFVPKFPSPGFGDVFVSTAYAEPIPLPPPQGNSGGSNGNGGNSSGQGGSSPGNSGNAPGQTGSTPGQGGSSPGNSGNAPGQTGSTPGQGGSNSGSGSTGSSSSGSGSSGTTTTGSGSSSSTTTTGDTKVYSMYIFTLTQIDSQHWSCTGEPIRDRLNSKFYFTDQTNVIRYSIGSLADSLSSQL